MLHVYIDFSGAFAYTQQLLALSYLSLCPRFCPHMSGKLRPEGCL